MLAPLLPVIEGEFGLGHGEAGSLFLLISSGYGAGLFGSTFVSSRLNYRRTILLSAMTVGGAMLGMSRSASVPRMHAGLLLIGISAGLYLPSGIAMLTDLVSKEHWGKAMAIHELAPTLGLITAPLLVEYLLKLVSWHGIFGILGVSSILMGVLFLLFGRGGSQKGEPPNPKAIQKILVNSSFWIMTAVFVFSIGASLGLYTMLPLFLVNEMGFDRKLANTIIGFSRLSGVIIIFFSGLITDRIGHKQAMIFFLAIAGMLTLMLGIFHGSITTPTLIILQATSLVCFFPPALAMVSLIFPSYLRSLSFSLLVFIGFFFGAGIIPPAIGYLADAFSFSFGFSFIGILILTILPLLFYL